MTWLAWLLALAASALVTVEDSSPAIRDGRLVEPIGIETLGGVFTPILPEGCALPCEKTELFSTASDNQKELKISLARGRATMLRNAHALGQFEVSGWKRAKRGVPKIAVTFAAVGDRIELRAVDQLDGLALGIVRKKR